MELRILIAVGQGGGHQLRSDPGRQQPALDAVRTPAVQRSAVLGEAPRVASIVEVALPLQLLERRIDRRRADALALEVAAHLEDGPVAACEEVDADVQRVLKVRLRIGGALGRRHGRYAAAWSRTAGGVTPGVAASSGSIGAAGSRSMPIAA